MNYISPEFLEKIKQKLKSNKQIRLKLPFAGKINIDRQLPFLVIYRKPPNYEDLGTEKLVLGEASYIVASGRKEFQKDLSNLIKEIVKIQKEIFGSSLIIEIWASNRDFKTINPEFTVYRRKKGELTEEVEILEGSLKKIKIHGKQAIINNLIKSVHPPDLKPVINSKTLNKLNSFLIGIEIKPIYRNIQKNEIYPYELRKIHHGLSVSIKKSVFQFSKEFLKLDYPHYQILGRRSFTNAVWSSDKRLAKIQDLYDFLLLSTPVNLEEQWEIFRKNKYKVEPNFQYRLCPVNPPDLKKELYSIPVEKIEDPVLYSLFSEKREEIDTQLSMLSERGSYKFLLNSIRLYGKIGEDIVKQAENILKNTKEIKFEKRNIDAKSFYKLAKKEIAFYKRHYPELKSKIQIRDDIVSRAMVSNGNLLINKYAKFSNIEAKAVLNHEIGTHILTYFNGMSQKFKMLHTGLAGYDELQEGLAVLAEYLSGSLTSTRLKILAGRVIAADFISRGANFIETFKRLFEDFNIPERTAYDITARIFRGGGLIKDAIYLRGLINLIQYIKDGGDLEILYIGKIGLQHIPLIKELLHREILHKPVLIPQFLKDEENLKRLKKLKEEINSVEQLIN
jgi:uncharacterized protein (TIGR02421 family)